MLKKIREAGVKHLLIDLPSVDKEFDNGEEDWYGVELLGTSYGNTDGTVNCVTYFQTKEDCGLFILPTKVIRKLSPGDFDIDLDTNNDEEDDCPEGSPNHRVLTRQNSNVSNISSMSNMSGRSTRGGSRRDRHNRTLPSLSNSRPISERRHGSTGQLGGMHYNSTVQYRTVAVLYYIQNDTV